jgi:TRAP-type C4-dicarboxylate transport system permease small subunit
MTLLVGAQVLVRFITKNAIDMSWSEEATRFLLCYMVFFGTVLVYESHGHVWVSNLVDAVPNVVRKIMLTLSYLVQLFFCGAVFLGSAQYMPIVATQYSNVLHIPLNYLYAIIPVTIAFILAFCIRDLILMLMGKGDLKNG